MKIKIEEITICGFDAIIIEGDTSMDNFDMREFLFNIDVDEKIIRWS